MDGLIVKGVGGFYYVRTATGIYQARGRGIFKKEGMTLMVGDEVDLEVLPDGDGVINAIAPRKNALIRPPIANVDCVVVTVAAARPKPNFQLIDRFLVMAAQKSMEAVLCINKCDLVTEAELTAMTDIYAPLYPVVAVSAKQAYHLDALRALLQGKRTAFAGPSGVGKSTLTNLLAPHAQMETGQISHKTNRGRHTTRHVEIFPLEDGGLLFDTPGFTSFDLIDVDETQLRAGYPEFAPLQGQCRFADCRHRTEPGCAVRAALAAGEISPVRYRSYLANLEELERRKKY